MSTPNSSVLTLHCQDRPGIVAAVSSTLAAHRCSITQSKTFEDSRNGMFFARVAFTGAEQGAAEVVPGPSTDAPASPREESASAGASTPALEADFAQVAAEFGMELSIHPAERKLRVVVMVSKWVHCLRDLLYRAQAGHLPVEITAVVSNHEDHRALTEFHGVPFHHVPVTRDTKPAAEARLMEIVESTGADLVVLARYMQVLSAELTERLEGRCINIHHSFLPSFKGAKPYHQAFNRGVKMVGATAHYVNSDLDEGPIITQRTAEVDHSYGPEDLQRHGQDAEVAALTDAVRMHAEHRVFLHEGRTVVLR